MILVREVFQLKIGKAKEAKELWREAVVLAKKYNMSVPRAYTDLIGPAYYTMVWEGTHESLAEWENSMNNPKAAEEWGAWYQKFGPLIAGGHREVFTVVE